MMGDTNLWEVQSIPPKLKSPNRIKFLSVRERIVSHKIDVFSRERFGRW